MILIPTAMGAALYKAAQSAKQGSNTPVARVIRTAVKANERRYLRVL